MTEMYSSGYSASIDNPADKTVESNDGHVISSCSWLEGLKRDLPSRINGACKVTLGLDVDDTKMTEIKIKQLMDNLNGKLCSRNYI